MESKKACTFTFAEWPLSQSLLQAFGLGDSWLEVPITFSNTSLGIDMPEDPVSEEDDARLAAIVFRLGQCFLRDPLVREDFYEGGPRPLSCAHFPGVDMEALRARLQSDGVTLVPLADLLAKRQKSEPKLSVKSLSTDYTKGEGIVDRHRRIREVSKLSAPKLMARTLANRASWRYGFTSAAFWVLSRADKAKLFAVDDPGQTAYFLRDLFLGYGTHPELARRFVGVLRSPCYAAATLPLSTVAAAVDATAHAYELGVQALGENRERDPDLPALDDSGDRLRLARALYQRQTEVHHDDLRTAVQGCLADPHSAHAVSIEDDLPVVFQACPDLGLRWLPLLWQDRDAEDRQALFKAADKHLPRKPDRPAQQLWSAAARAARTGTIRKPLAKLLKKRGLDIDALAPLPKKLEDLSIIVEVGVDGATLALVDPHKEGTREDDEGPTGEELLGLVNRGQAAGFHTGQDGVFRVLMTGQGLAASLAKKADAGTRFVVPASKGELCLDSGTERASFAIPKGRYAVSVRAIARGRADELPDYVFVFGKTSARAKPKKRKQLPTTPRW